MRRLPQPPDGSVWAAGFVAMPVYAPAYSVAFDRRAMTACWRLRDADELGEAARLVARAQAAFEDLPRPLPLAQAQPLARALLEAAQLHATIREARLALLGGETETALALLAPAGKETAR